MTKGSASVKRHKKKIRALEKGVRNLGSDGFYQIGVQIARMLDAGMQNVQIEKIIQAVEAKSRE